MRVGGEDATCPQLTTTITTLRFDRGPSNSQNMEPDPGHMASR
ncbi:MAG: hypothetical protein ACLP1X_04520 [Polyangiaceae bacterium]